MTTNGSLPVQVPTILWAQRNDRVFLTVDVVDLEKPEIKIEENSVHFSCSNNKIHYQADLDLYGELDVKESKYGIYGQKHWMLILVKKESGPYWPRLLKVQKKNHWLKADWNKWKDEDDVADEDVDAKGDAAGGGGAGNMDFDSMFKQMGGMGGMGGIGGMEGMGDLGEPEDPNEQLDSDDEKIPDLEENTTKP